MQNQNLCVSCGDIFMEGDMLTASDGKRVCHVCEKEYEKKINKVFSFQEELKRKELKQFMEEQVLLPVKVDWKQIDEKLLNRSLDDFVMGIKFIPARRRKEVYSLWLKDLIEDYENNPQDIDIVEASTILYFLTLDDEDFEEIFDEKEYWSKFNDNPDYKRAFVNMVLMAHNEYQMLSDLLFGSDN